jgi:hypothetical protein
MKNSWRHFIRRLAAVSVVGGVTAWSSAVCYAVQLAFDSASDPVYADGWQGSTTDDSSGAPQTTGDNGGFGFEPWDFDTDTIYPVLPGNQTIDDGLRSGSPNSSQFNSIGKSWRMGLPTPVNGVGGIPRAGRGFPALQPGQTLKVIIDNPTARQFFKGYFVRFSTRMGDSGGGNICYGGEPCEPGTNPLPKLNIQRFEYNDNGQWVVVNGGSPNSHHIPLFDTDTAVNGAEIDLTITSADHYSLSIDPIGHPELNYTETGVLDTQGFPIDWMEFTFFNTVAAGAPGDYNNNGVVDAADYTVWRDHLGQTFQLPNEAPNVSPGTVDASDYSAWKAHFGATPNADTDLFIRSMEIDGAGPGGAVPEPSTFVYLVTALGGLVALKSVMART